MNELQLCSLSKYNTKELNNHQISQRGPAAYATVVKYLRNKTDEPSLFSVARILKGMGVSWEDVTVADLVKIKVVE